jgi:hypothetical protein
MVAVSIACGDDYRDNLVPPTKYSRLLAMVYAKRNGELLLYGESLCSKDPMITEHETSIIGRSFRAVRTTKIGK